MAIDPDILAIGAALKERGIPRAKLGHRLSLDSKQINRLFNGERKLQKHELEIAREWLWPGTSAPPLGGRIVPMPGLVPIFGGVGASSEYRLTFAEQDVRGYAPMHPAQANLVGAFALEVADISMVPRYEPGELVYLAPNRWPAKNHDCVLVTTDSYGFLKRYLARDEETVHLFQLNPEKELEFKRPEVSAIHAVVGRG